ALSTSTDTSDTISNSEIGALMHGPTFMANPLACSVANASIDLLLCSPWNERVKKIEEILSKKLEQLKNHSLVKNVRNIG
ncbi:aminotransferase class III-fold pyridoxal phosphate-dependent enzyme, partial [Aliarcobacter butzleri]